MAWWKGKRVEHLALRLLALLLAVVLWFMATDRPQQTIGSDQRVLQVETRLSGVDDALEVTDRPGTVDVTVEGPRLILSFQAQEVRAYVELAGVGPGRHQVPVRVEAPSGVTVRQVVPGEVSVTLEARARKSVPVRVALQGVPPGVVVRVVEAQPQSMEVYGAASAVERVAYILAQVAYDSGSGEVAAVAVGLDGEAVEGVATERPRVRVEIAVDEVAEESLSEEEIPLEFL